MLNSAKHKSSTAHSNLNAGTLALFCFQNPRCCIYNFQAATKSLKIKSSTKAKKNANKWYDEELYVKRRQLNSKANLMFEKPFNNALRNLHYKHYRKYRKLLKYKRKKYTKSIFF